MGDITTAWSAAASTFDWTHAGGALASGDDLATAVILSLFTDRQANADDVVLDASRRGWWGDPTMGSRLWLLERSKRTDETARLAQEYALEALDWLVGDGIAAGVTAAAFWIDARSLGLRVEVRRVDGSNPWTWEGLGLVLT